MPARHRARACIPVVVAVLAMSACRPGGSTEPSPAADEPALPAAAPSPEGTLGHQIRFEFGGTPMPGCFAADEPFQAVVRSYWGDQVAVNTLTYRWSRPPAGAEGIVMRLDGQDLMKRLDPGDAFPPVNLRLPLGNVTMSAKLVTFVFTSMDEDARACFRWLNPPGTPPEIEVQPQGNTDA